VGRDPCAKVGHDRTTLLALASGCRRIVVHRAMKEVYGGIDAAILVPLDLFPPVQISWQPAIESVVAHYRTYCVHCVVIKTSAVEAIAGGQSKQSSARVAVARTLHNHASRPQRDWQGIGRMARFRVVLTYGKAKHSHIDRLMCTCLKRERSETCFPQYCFVIVNASTGRLSYVVRDSAKRPSNRDRTPRRHGPTHPVLGHHAGLALMGTYARTFFSACTVSSCPV